MADASSARSFIASRSKPVYPVRSQRTFVSMRILSLYFLLASLATAPAALAQDPVSVNSGTVKVAFENDQIRVLHARYAPHQKIPIHSHPSHVVVYITDMHVLVTSASGATEELHNKAGDSRWSEPVTHSVENLEDTPFEVVEVELKNAAAPAVPVPPPGSSAAALTEPVPVDKEPRHHFVFQNQYVRVLDVLFPAGEASLFHTHSNDNVGIPLSGDSTQSQPAGGEWSEVQDVKPGQAGFRDARGQPYTHRVRSAGKLPFHVIDVEIFP
jgi:quercetin dioxygenase-like cupin family protein